MPVPDLVCYAGQFRHLLSYPEVTELLAAAPQIARLLRPVGRLL